MDKMRRKPNFITIEGIDGVGKTTAVGVIRRYLDDRGINNLVVRQNRDTPLGKLIRSYIEDESNQSTSVDTLAYLYCAGINDTVSQLIEPAHLSGKIVISDRYTMSTRVYQSASRYVDAMCEAIESNLSPDITFLLDAPPSVVRERILSRAETGDIMESVSCNVLNERRKGFMRLARARSKSTYVIDASRTPEFVADQITAILSKLY